MMTRSGGSRTAIGAVALVLMLAPLPLAAQGIDGYRLPGATVRPAPGAPGPVDRDNPVVTTAIPRPAPSPVQTAPTTAPSPGPTPAPTPAATVTQAPRPAAVQPQRTVAARPSPTAPASGLAATAPVPADQAAAPAAQPFPEILPPPAATAAPAAAPQAVAAGWYWPWLAAIAALLAAVFAALWWRKQRVEAPLAITFEPPVVAAPRPEPDPAPPPAAIMPEPRLSAAPTGSIGIEFEPRRMNASLMATTLNYVLRLTNHGNQALTGLAIEGDMIAAHASLSAEAQLASNRQRLEPRHAVVALAPGESVELTGDFRLPLTAINPIRAGDAAYFVPLARLRVAAGTVGGGSLIEVQTWVVGELPEAEGAALKPFRLDLGPRTYSRVGQRAVN